MMLPKTAQSTLPLPINSHHLNPRRCKIWNLKLDIDGRLALGQSSVHAGQEELGLKGVTFRKRLGETTFFKTPPDI